MDDNTSISHTRVSIEIVGIFLPLVMITIILYFCWNIYFLKKVRFFIKERSKALERAKYDILGNFAQLAENHKVEIVKYSFLFAINIIEAIALTAIVAAYATTYLVIYRNNSLNFPDSVETSNCTSEYLSVKNMLTVSSLIPPLNLCRAFAQVGLIFLMALCICLLKFLQNSYYNIRGNYRWILRFLSFTSFLCIIMLILSSVPSLMIFGFLFEPLIQLGYFCLLIKYLRIFKQTLKRQTIDLKIISKPKAAIEKSIRLAKQFAVFSSLNCIGIGCGILINFLTHYTFVISILIYFAPCFSEYAYGKALYQSLLVYPIQINQLKKAVEIIDLITNFLFAIASFCITSPFFLMSFLMFGSKLWKDLRTRFGVPPRFTPILTQPMLK